MTKQKPAAFALGTALAGLTLAGSTFAMEPLAQGYMLAASDTAKAQEGKCGMGKADADGDGRISQAEFAAAHPDKAEHFSKMDTNQDGFVDEAEHKAHHAAKAGEGKCGDKAEKKAGEGKCGEGKCGEGKCGGAA
ncbi:HvfA family oxazolone/thioamide-modified RiPP metallophore [Pseudoxanthomonas suwonensis]|uniref:HvfA family oxazolone/thioamide-modified RiPP metallophore n=1 Tax=Pseudoxanthomonas suwonensis TaxID=314722 RepID=UPI0004B3E0E9|nr:hypothetical protein [Pseudoxanthomonas suwonensis]